MTAPYRNPMSDIELLRKKYEEQRRRSDLSWQRSLLITAVKQWAEHQSNTDRHYRPTRSIQVEENIISLLARIRDIDPGFDFEQFLEEFFKNG